MPMHPPAPTDLPDLIAAWRQTIAAVADLEVGLSEGDLDLTTAFHGTPVRDLIAQVKASAAEPLQLLATDPAEDDEVVLDHVRRSAAQTWIYEQDIREALHRPGNLDTPAAALFFEIVEHAFAEKVIWVAGERGLPAGTGVIVESTGPLVGRMGVWMNEDETGRVAIRMFQGDLEHSGVTEVIPLPRITSIALSTEELSRRVAGRRPVAETHYTVGGDSDLAAHVLDAMVIPVVQSFAGPSSPGI